MLACFDMNILDRNIDNSSTFNIKTFYVACFDSFETRKHGWCLPRVCVSVVLDLYAVTMANTDDGSEHMGTTYLLFMGAGLAVDIVGVHCSCYVHQLFCTYGLYITPIAVWVYICKHS